MRIPVATMQHSAGKLRELLTHINHSSIRSVISSNMGSTREKPVQDPQAAYGLEVLCASWNPLVAAVAEPVEACGELVAEPGTIEAESFLASFYRFQQG